MGVLLAPGPRSVARAQDGGARPREYWQAIVEAGYAVPAGEEPFELLADLFLNLGSPDPVLRDDYAYGITARWVLRQRLLDAEDGRVLIERLLANLQEGIGEQGTDTVLLRSFSALNLSLFAALDLEAPFLEAEDFDMLLDGALTYLAEEKDVRGHDPTLGWLHSTAHTADLLRFLARNARLDPAGQERILQAVARKTAAAGVVYTHGEDERLARALVSVLARDDFEVAFVERFLATLREGCRRRSDAPPGFDPVQHGARQNTVQLLRALYVMLATEAEPPRERGVARDAILAALAEL